MKLFPMLGVAVLALAATPAVAQGDESDRAGDIQFKAHQMVVGAMNHLAQMAPKDPGLDTTLRGSDHRPSVAESVAFAHRIEAVVDPMAAIERSVTGDTHPAATETLWAVWAPLMEEFAYDDQGQMMSQTFMDYLLPSSHEVPQVEIVHHCTPSPLTVFGQKGSGESGYLGSPAAISGAINDAVAPFGVRFEKLPIRMTKISDAVAAARSGKA
jgi:hypothetical protein